MSSQGAWRDKEHSASLCSCDSPTVTTTKAQRQAVTSSLRMKAVPSSSKLGLIQAASCGLNLLSLHKLGREKSSQTAGSDWHLTLTIILLRVVYPSQHVLFSNQLSMINQKGQFSKHDISERTCTDEPSLLRKLNFGG